MYTGASKEVIKLISLLRLKEKSCIKAKKGLEIYNKFKEANFLSDLKSFAVGLAKSVVNRALSAINEVLPVMETIALLKKDNKDLGGGEVFGTDCDVSKLKETCKTCGFIQAVPTAYSFKSSAGSVAVFESMQFVITDAHFPNKLEKEGR